MKLKIFLLTALTLLAIPSRVHAASFSLRVGQPKTPTNQSQVSLTFSALDTQDNRNITVQCFVTPPGGSESLFQTVVLTKINGDSESCSTSFSNSGTYSFRIVGSVSTPDPGESITKTLTVDYNTSGPSTPVSYSKEKLNSCDYKIRFKTADDGKTVKVQLFRSDTLNISVGSSAVISGMNIAPNTEGEIINSVPTCGKDYYYVLRAVDNSDNVSGVIGDSFTTTTIVGSTSTQQTGTNNLGAIPVNGVNTQVNNPADSNNPNSDNTTGNASGSANTQDVSVTPSPSVLGTSTDSKKTFYKWLLALTATLVCYLIFTSLKKSKAK